MNVVSASIEIATTPKMSFQLAGLYKKNLAGFGMAWCWIYRNIYEWTMQHSYVIFVYLCVWILQISGNMWIFDHQKNHTRYARSSEALTILWIITHRIHVWYIYANIWGILMVNVAIYSIHGSYGLWYMWLYQTIATRKQDLWKHKHKTWHLPIQFAIHHY